jgi:hypothetical protein
MSLDLDAIENIIYDSHTVIEVEDTPNGFTTIADKDCNRFLWLLQNVPTLIAEVRELRAGNRGSYRQMYEDARLEIERLTARLIEVSGEHSKQQDEIRELRDDLCHIEEDASIAGWDARRLTAERDALRAKLARVKVKAKPIREFVNVSEPIGDDHVIIAEDRNHNRAKITIGQLRALARELEEE